MENINHLFKNKLTLTSGITIYQPPTERKYFKSGRVKTSAFRKQIIPFKERKYFLLNILNKYKDIAEMDENK
jgi:hypothetical protein